MFAVKAFAQSGRLITIRRPFRSHRDARRYALKRENELRARFGFKLFIAGE